ncbi:hypothetical protein BJ165DRAFT_1357982 [Panaeolus papilionaceus]|nr:hypothetical protein BJ165DRAFT_1357982 [Panaeolus papilionaceus]
MDNATNCDKLAELLPEHLPSFPGEKGRLRCLAHIFNLIAKVFISFFFKTPKKRKHAGGAKRTPAGQGKFKRTRMGDVEASVDDSDDEPDDDGSGADVSDDDVAVNEEAVSTAEAFDDDEGQSVHNEHISRSIKAKATAIMRQKGITIDPHEEKIAQQIFPRVAGLARRVHDSHALADRFQKLVDEDNNLRDSQRTLARRVPTRWNSDLACLLAHFDFRDVITVIFTAAPSNGVQAYRLTDEQWSIAEDVKQILLLFDRVTKIFSRADVALVVDTISTLEELQEGLIGARDDQINNVPNVVRVACHAGVMLIDKYSLFASDCDVYLIAIVMCPDKKLKWFKDHGRTAQQIRTIRKLVIAKWTEIYEPEDEPDDSGAQPGTRRQERVSIFFRDLIPTHLSPGSPNSASLVHH